MIVEKYSLNEKSMTLLEDNLFFFNNEKIAFMRERERERGKTYQSCYQPRIK